ncbi:protein tramtrack, beta isoform isoform X1 [Dendroctonus ponderosae]|uniref:BTB domain-containing protein n=1 Tax=Dendroctonus ponderosae TaxID=77166 RepID=A0AAR5PJU0_DENPD|nr:protein tramtrack, beta isoform isoform X1 [Dendroctonus ponderosae]
MASEQFSLCWDNFHKNMSSGMNALLEHEDLVDVTLAVEGRLLKAHKMVLSVCSPYFKELFKSNPCQHPIVFMKDVSYVAMSDLLQFMYQGEVQVSQDNLTTFIKTAEALQIKGLTGDGNGSTDAETESLPEKPATRHTEESYKPMSRPKKQPLTPSVTTSPNQSAKRARLTSNDSQSSLTPITKTEPASAQTANTDSAVQFKVEPYDQNQSVLTDDDGGENMDDMLDDSTVDGAEDYSMMEGEEPQAGTSTDGTGEGQDGASTTLPERSRRHYEAVYNTFMDWHSLQDNDTFGEEVILSYFKVLRQSYSPASLWAYYSMLRSTLIIHHQVHIETYAELRSFLKANAKGYKAKKAKMFTQKDVQRFLREAPDKVHLANKVALILASTGACRPAELRGLSLEDIVDFGSAMMVTIPRAKSRYPRQFTVAGQEYEFIRRYIELRPNNAQSSALFLNYQSGKCTTQHIGVNKLSNMVKQIAKFLQLPNPEQYSGYSFRKSSSWMQKH